MDTNRRKEKNSKKKNNVSMKRNQKTNREERRKTHGTDHTHTQIQKKEEEAITEMKHRKCPIR